jgi:hypothetical protein
MFAEHLCIKGPLVAVPVSILGPKVQDIKSFNFLKSKWSLCSQDTICYPRRDPDLSLDSQPPIQTSSGANFVCAECDAVFSEEGPYIARYHLMKQHQLTGASANKRLILPDRLLVARCICSFTMWTDASHFKQELRPHRESEHRDTRTSLSKLFSVECRVCDFHLVSLPLSGSSLSEHVASHSDEYHPPLPAVAVVVNSSQPSRDRRKTVRDSSDTNGKSAQIAATVSMKNDIESMFALFYEARSVCPALLEDLIHAAVDISEGLRQPTAVGSPDRSRGE